VGRRLLERASADPAIDPPPVARPARQSPLNGAATRLNATAIRIMIMLMTIINSSSVKPRRPLRRSVEADAGGPSYVSYTHLTLPATYPV